MALDAMWTPTLQEPTIRTILRTGVTAYTTNEMGTLGCQGTPFGPLPGVLFIICSILGWFHTPGDPGVEHIYM
jgi:hypothetical protein